MTFIEAVKSGFLNFCRTSGRASRSEFWYWVLFSGLIVFCLIFLLSFIDNISIANNDWILVPFVLIVLVLFVSNFITMVRRLHDINMRGWWAFLTLIPQLGSILYICWGCIKGNVGANRFGDDPLAKKH